MSACEGSCGVSLWYHVIILASIKSRGAASSGFITGLYRCRPAFKHSRAISNVSILARRDCTAPPPCRTRTDHVISQHLITLATPTLFSRRDPKQSCACVVMLPSFGTSWWLGEGGSRSWGRSVLASRGKPQLQAASAGSRADLMVRDVSGQGRL